MLAIIAVEQRLAIAGAHHVADESLPDLQLVGPR